MNVLTELEEMREFIEGEKSQIKRLRGVLGRREVMFSGGNGLKAMLKRMTWEWGERERMRNGDWAINHITSNDVGIENRVDSPG